MGTRRNNNVTITPKRRRDVVLTPDWRCYCAMFPLGVSFWGETMKHLTRKNIMLSILSREFRDKNTTAKRPFNPMGPVNNTSKSGGRDWKRILDH